MNINIILILGSIVLLFVFHMVDTFFNIELFVIRCSTNKYINFIIQLVVITIGVYIGFYAPQFLK